ncbi:MAG: methyltransferase domain-containing protein [Candidatus Omnitrophota bacterium]
MTKQINVDERLKKAASGVIRSALAAFCFLIRTVKPPRFPENPDGKVLVNIGCGECNDPRYINIDARAMPHIHYVSSDLERLPFSGGSIDLIYACHVIEHLSHQKLRSVISVWFSRLKRGGILRLSVPDFDAIIDIYQDQGKSIDAIKLPLLGGQEHPFNYHNAIFNDGYLRKILKECGFDSVRTWDPKTAPYYSFDDWASKPFIVGGRSYRISLNLEAVK